MKKILILSAAIVLSTAALAQQGQGRGQPGMGPVAQNCQDDIVKFCPGKEHGTSAVRDCLEAKAKELTAACQTALKSTGRGRR